MNEIRKKLYLGSYEDAEDTAYLESKNITHILTVHEKKLHKNYRKNFKYKFIKTDYEIDLFSRFNESIDFIKEGINEGGVLVHCQLGMSRSAAVVMAYIMSEDDCDETEALATVRALRRVVSPDDSLLIQLKLFRQMSCNLDESLPIYRYYKNYRALAHHDLSQMILASVHKEEGKAFYECKNCHKALFTADNFIYHFDSMDDVDMYLFEYFDVTEDSKDLAKICEKGSIYIEPMEWMNLLQGTQQNLVCGECNHKIGHYCLAGEMCPCLKWVFPAIFIDCEEVSLSQ